MPKTAKQARTQATMHDFQEKSNIQQRLPVIFAKQGYGAQLGMNVVHKVCARCLGLSWSNALAVDRTYAPSSFDNTGGYIGAMCHLSSEDNIGS
eukprot:2475722-Amphidinium_carterae.1